MNKRILFTLIIVLIIISANIYSFLTFWPYLTKTKNDAETLQKMQKQELKRINDSLKSNLNTFVITYQPEFDKEYTKKSSLALFGDRILLKYNGNALEIRPFILSSSQERYLIANEFDFFVRENGFYRKWKVVIKNVSSFLNSSLCSKKDMLIGFDLIGENIKRYGDYSFVWNSILIDFYDLVEHNFEVFIINDSRVLIGNLTLNIINDFLFLDPTDQLLPNSTHKAYKGTTDNQDNPFLATTEMSYSYINNSDNIRDSSYISHSLTLACSYGGTCSCYGPDYLCPEGPADCANIAGCTASCPSMTNARTITTCSRSATSVTCGCVDWICTGTGTCSCYYTGSCTYACNSQYFDCDNSASNGCEATSACYRYAFHRFTFNLSAYEINNIQELKYCWEGYYTTADNVTITANLQWYNASSGAWVYDKAISTSESTYCTVFTANNITDFINSTSKIAQFAVKLKMSKQAHRTIYLYTDFVNLTVKYIEIPTIITVISPENKTYNTLFFWANISLNKPGSVALYSLDNQPNQTLIKFNDTYFYKKVYSTKGNHKIIFYANDTEGIMVNSSEIYFYLNVTGYTTIELSTNRAWWNDPILVYGEAKDWEGRGMEDSLVKVTVGERECENYTDQNGIWLCKINAPDEIGNHLLNIDVGGIKNFTYLKVSPFYGKEEKNVEKRVYETPVLIQDKNGKIKVTWLRVTSY